MDTKRRFNRIKNSSGRLVRRIHKDSPTILDAWDLTNDHSWLIAIGM